MGNLAQNLIDTAAELGRRPALRMGDTVLTYDQFAEAARRVAAGLDARSVVPGDRVGLLLPNVLSFPIVVYGALMAGAVAVPLNPLLKAQEIHYFLQDSGARLVVAAPAAARAAADAAGLVGIETVVVEGAHADELMVANATADPAARTDDDRAAILYSSGTTGPPKGAELTHGSLSGNARTTVQTLLDATPEDIVLGCLPLFHAFGLTCGLNAAVLSGASVTLLPRFDGATALSLIEREKVTLFEGVPTMFSRMLHAPNAGSVDLARLRLSVSGGAAMPVEVMRSFEQTFGCVVLEGYGLTETSPVVTFNHPAGRKAGSIGTPITGVEVRLVDEGGKKVPNGEVGEIAVRGPNVMKGYWGKPEETAKAIPDGWFRTGDLARQDVEGYLFIVDRKKDMIIRGGENVYPREIEEVLYEHPAVAEVACVGIPDPDLGEEVGAAVVLKPGADVDPDELREWVKARVAGYKYPRHVWLVDSLPHGPTGKIVRRAVQLPPGPGQAVTAPSSTPASSRAPGAAESAPPP
jgi:long-chain acyl-CoA synthetase